MTSAIHQVVLCRSPQRGGEPELRKRLSNDTRGRGEEERKREPGQLATIHKPNCLAWVIKESFKGTGSLRQPIMLEKMILV